MGYPPGKASFDAPRLAFPLLGLASEIARWRGRFLFIVDIFSFSAEIFLAFRSHQNNAAVDLRTGDFEMVGNILRHEGSIVHTQPSQHFSDPELFLLLPVVVLHALVVGWVVRSLGHHFIANL